jgi:hypothetical protein
MPKRLIPFLQLSGNALAAFVGQPRLRRFIRLAQPFPNQAHLLRKSGSVVANRQMKPHADTFTPRQPAIQ